MKKDVDSFPFSAARRRVLAGAAGTLGTGLTANIAWTAQPAAAVEAEPFRVAIPQSALDDLEHRLAQVRWPDRETVSDWSQGVPLAKAQALVDYWRERHDWRKCEARLNRHPQFHLRIDGLRIHYLHVKSRHADALPLVLTHGWPGSIVEFLNVIGPLTDPVAHGGRAADAFHVVIPSLPGFGFSDKPVEPGWDVLRTARAWAALMQRLGYEKWVAQGGDWGAAITHALGKQRPAGLVAAHVNWPLVLPDTPPANPTVAEKQALDSYAVFRSQQIAYFNQQSTRPQTLAYGLADSPVGQALWIYEKFHAWTDNRGNPEDALSVDEMLDDITLYWLTGTAASSARIYWDNARTPASASRGRIELPMAATIFPREIYRAQRSWAEAVWPNLIYWNEVDRGGHFAAWEQPALFAEELRKAFRTVR